MGNDDSGGSSHGNIYNRILSTFLNELDGIAVANSSSSLSSFVLVIVACKSLDILDEALIRPGSVISFTPFNLLFILFKDDCNTM